MLIDPCPYPDILYICINVLFVVYDWILVNALFYPYPLTYRPVLTSLTIPDRCIVSLWRFGGLFYCSYTVLGDWLLLLIICEVVSLYPLEFPIISSFFFNFLSTLGFFCHNWGNVLTYLAFLVKRVLWTVLGCLGCLVLTHIFHWIYISS